MIRLVAIDMVPESDMRFTKEPVETPAYHAEAEDVEYEEPVLEKAQIGRAHV